MLIPWYDPPAIAHELRDQEGKRLARFERFQATNSTLHVHASG
jgi:hypothetical protein